MTRIALSRPDDLATAVRTWRTQAGLSQAGLADRLGTTQSALSRWENGREEPRVSTLAAIVAACGLVGEIVVDTDVDRAQIRQQLALTPAERLEAITNVSRLRSRARVVG